MTKFKKFAALTLATITAVSAMNMTAFAAENIKATSNVAINDSVYDEDIEYIPEHAEIIEEYNRRTALARATSYSAWSWSYGIYSRTTGDSCTMVIPYYFTPVNNYLYFNVDVTSKYAQPYMTVNKYVNGSLSYVGSYTITNTGTNTYEWSNKKRSLTAGTPYVFTLLNDTDWTNASIDIYKSSM